MNPVAAIDVRGVHVTLGSNAILRGLDLSIPAGQIVALIGPNGSGKTTLLKAILGLQPIDSGEIRIFGEPVSSRVMERVGYVPQRLDIDRNFLLSVREFLAVRLTRRWLWESHAKTDARIRAALVEIGAESLLDRPLGRLSGGQLQRVLIAFSLLHQPEMLLLDEPTAGIDFPGEQSFYDLISDVQKRRHLTVVLVSHDLSMVHRHAAWVYALNGVICCEGPPEQIMNADSLKQAFGIHVSPYNHHHHDHSHHAH